MREASWILVLSCFVSMLVSGAAAQDTSNDGNVHDIHVPLCPALLSEFNGMS
jgi:hypothetical protein